jgi:hypothetical protein
MLFGYIEYINFEFLIVSILLHSDTMYRKKRIRLKSFNNAIM